MFDCTCDAAAIQIECDYIDADALGRYSTLFAVANCAAPHALELGAAERFGGKTGFAAAGAYFDKDEVVAVFSDEIHLNAADARVSGDDVHPGGLEPVGRYALSEITKLAPRRHHRNAYCATGA